MALFSEAARSFLRAFGGALLILAPGALSAPDLNSGVALGIAALIAALAAGLKAIQVFVPQLSFKSLNVFGVYYTIVDSFARAFIAALITGLLGLLQMPTLTFSKSLVVALLIGAVTAGIRAAQGLLTKGDVPAPPKGFNTPTPQP